MGAKRQPARAVARELGPRDVWIDHAALAPEDATWLAEVEYLTLWNVTAPDGFLASLPKLWGLDIRGGSAADLRVVDGCSGLRCLVVNQVLGMRDLSLIPALKGLELLHVYGLKQVTEAPSLAALENLRRLEAGQMKGLEQLGGLLDAPFLEELVLLRSVNVTSDDVARIQTHPSLAYFDWLAEDVADHRWVPVVDAITLPKPAPLRPRDWFARRP